MPFARSLWHGVILLPRGISSHLFVRSFEKGVMEGRKGHLIDGRLWIAQ